mgnify:CR=1 FL=1
MGNSSAIRCHKPWKTAGYNITIPANIDPGLAVRFYNDSVATSGVGGPLSFTELEQTQNVAPDFWKVCSSKTNANAINIREATLKSMHDSIHQLKIIPDHILVDGNAFYPYQDPRDEDSYIEHTCVIKGDDTYTSIAAASILAKVARDKYIEEICDKYPILDEYYNISKNKGYGAKVHIEGIKRYGITKFHRRSFGLCKQAPFLDIDS